MAQKRPTSSKKSKKSAASSRSKAKNKRQTAKQKRQQKQQKSSTQLLGNSAFSFEWWHLALIAILTFAVYTPALDNDFVNWDDIRYIVDNEVVHSFSGENIAISFTQEVSDNYHPLTNLSQTLDWVIGGGNATIFHVTSLILHIINSILVFFFVLMLTGKQWVGLGSALIFSLHPAHVESVAWATERKDVLYGLFFILALIQYLQYIRSSEQKHYIFALIFAVLSLFSKPAAVPFPLVLVLVDYLEGRKLTDSKVVLEKVPFFVLSIIFGLITVMIQENDAVRTFEEVSFFERIIFASYAYVMYILKFFFPYPLYAFYPYPNLAEIPAYFYGMPILALAITGGVIWLGRKNKFLWFGLLFFLFVISITLQLIAVGGAIMADRYTYIPYIGLAISVLMGIDALLAKNKNLKNPLLIAGIAIGGIFGALTWQQTDTWKDGESLWTHLIDHAPQPVRIAHTNRGDFYKQNGESEKALADFNRALEISPNEVGTTRLRAKTYFDLQQYEKSLADYQQVVLTAREDHEAWSNIAIIQVLTKKYQDADKSLKRTLDINPNYAPAYKTQGYLYNETRNYQASIKAYQKFLSMTKADPTIYHAIAVGYQQLGNRQEALKAINEALRLNPNAEVYQQLKAQLGG